MKCKVCGTESGKYVLCRTCNMKKESGDIIKCGKCGNWHYANFDCSVKELKDDSNDVYLYNLKKHLISKNERAFYNAIQACVPDGYAVFPQINLAAFIEKRDSIYRNELFRIVDFLIVDAEYRPKLIIEINDHSHLDRDRKERDIKVQKICEEAGMPILKLWTDYGVNSEYIQNKIQEKLSMSIQRVHHFNLTNGPATKVHENQKSSASTHVSRMKGACYIATCVYGDYNSPKVAVLRRFRDITLSRTWYGRAFIRMYYTISPKLVELFGNYSWFHSIFKKILDKFICKLQSSGFENTPYNDI